MGDNYVNVTPATFAYLQSLYVRAEVEGMCFVHDQIISSLTDSSERYGGNYDASKHLAGTTYAVRVIA